MEELLNRIKEAEGRLSWLQGALHIDVLRAELSRLNKESEDPDLWLDRARGQRIMQELSEVSAEVERFELLDRSLRDLEEIASESIKEADTSLQAELESRCLNCERELASLEDELHFSGPHDSSDAYLSIYAGTGGTDAQDFAEMLLRMYLRFAERKSLKAGIISSSEGEGAGLKSATLKIIGRRAYGNLRSEHGVHRLVRLSPFNAQNLRQTSFVLVDVIPALDSAADLEIKDSDLRIDVFRSQGAGGQSVNTTDSAVRITHLPTGLVATCQNERSQLQNKRGALEILRAKLARLQEERREGEVSDVRGEHPSADWGSQIRSYVLHPYQMVKDHRTGTETTDTQAVLDGDLDNFIEAYLSWASALRNK